MLSELIIEPGVVVFVHFSNSFLKDKQARSPDFPWGLDMYIKLYI